MASNIQPAKGKLNRRSLTVIWSLVTAALVIGLLYYERIDILYILATLGLVALLLIVAFADLEGKNKVEG